jgi:hypothetical protein
MPEVARCRRCEQTAVPIQGGLCPRCQESEDPGAISGALSDEQPTQPAGGRPGWLGWLVAFIVEGAITVAAFAVPLPNNFWALLGIVVLVMSFLAWTYGKTRRERLVLVAFLGGLEIAGYWFVFTPTGWETVVGTVPGISCPTESSGGTNLRACARSSVAADAPQCESMFVRWGEEAGGPSQRAVSDFGPVVVSNGLAIPVIIRDAAIRSDGLGTPASNALVPPAGNTECVR